MKRITDTTKLAHASALHGLAVPAALVKTGLDSVGQIAKFACILGIVAGTLLASTGAHAAVNYQLEVENYYGKSIVIEEVRYIHNNTWWETVLAAGDGQTFGTGDCTAYTSSDGWNRDYCDESDNRGLYMHWSVTNLFGECDDNISWKVKFTVDGRTITVQNETPANRTSTATNCLDNFTVDEDGRVWLGWEVVNTELFEEGLVNIQARWGDLCLNAVGDQPSSTADVNMYDCAYVSEYWHLGTNGKIYAGWDTDLCLNIVGHLSTTNGTDANIYDCDYVAETWIFDDNDQKFHAAWDYNMCLNVIGNQSTTNGQSVNLYSCAYVSETFYLDHLY